ncbi:MAG: type VI secretion system ATPase TssH, partial [Sorangium cellulosum]
MRIDRMTTKSQEALRTSLDAASRRGNPELLPEHILVAALEQDEGVGAPLVQKAGGDPKQIVAALNDYVEGLPRAAGGAEPQMSRRGLQLVQKAEDQAKVLGDEYLSVEHLLLAAVQHDDRIREIFQQQNLTFDQLL